MNQPENSTLNHSVEIVIRIAVVVGILAWCFQILSPFISLILWGAIIAVSINTPFLKLATKFIGNKDIYKMINEEKQPSQDGIYKPINTSNGKIFTNS